MALLKVQFNHPGSQKPFKIGKGYRKIRENVIREWNNDKKHYRKFLLNNGFYVNNIKDSVPKKNNLYFWGEWEGNSIFNSIKNPKNQKLPNGIHKPIHSSAFRRIQNTDPYVFGDGFKYSVCKQRGNLCNLDANSLILFGSTFKSLGKFYIDTVYVVKSKIPATHVHNTVGEGFSQIYKEETLEQLNEYLKSPYKPSNKKLYSSQSWWDNKDYFSFVPCKLNLNEKGFERLFLNLNDPIFNLSSNATGMSFLKNCALSPSQLWNKIVDISLKQGFKLGIKFEEPIISNLTID
jgi:hypothetical protein